MSVPKSGLPSLICLRTKLRNPKVTPAEVTPTFISMKSLMVPALDFSPLWRRRRINEQGALGVGT